MMALIISQRMITKQNMIDDGMQHIRELTKNALIKSTKHGDHNPSECKISANLNENANRNDKITITHYHRQQTACVAFECSGNQ